MKKIKYALLVVCSLIITASFGFENDLTSICERPGTDELFVGGEFKTVLVVDKNTGTALRQLKLEDNVLDMQFSPDGKNFITFDGGKVHFFNPETGEETYFFKASGIRLIQNSPYIIEADWIFSKSVKLYSTEDGSQIYSMKPEFSILSAGLSPDFTELIILGKDMDIKKEKSLINVEIEKDEGYNVYNKAYVEQQQDSRGSAFMVVDIQSKTSKIDVEIPYTTSASFAISISKFGSNYYIVGWDIFIKIDNEGKAFPIASDDATFAYAAGTSLDGKQVFVASTEDGFMYNCETENQVKFDASESFESAYSVDFLQVGDLIYMLNKDYSISVLNKKGMVVKRLKIENATGSGKGFKLLYYNGFTKKEARDKEAAIINGVLKDLEMEPIDLETAIGESDFFLGEFKLQEDAKLMVDMLNANGLQYLVKIAPVE